MNWSDIGIVLSARKHGEGSAIVSLMTPEHGRHAGLVRGGSGKRARGIYEAGNLVAVEWRARIEEHLGTFTCELLKPQAALYLDDSLRLAGLSSACSVLEMALPERESHPDVYESLFNFIANLESDTWLESYVEWELHLLAELGFGLDLSSCASTGQQDELIYVSPKSGQAVSTNAGEPYKDKLLALPDFLMGAPNVDQQTDFGAVFLGLHLTGYFMDRHIFIHNKNGAPPARTRLVDRVKQKNTISDN
jgi:DNA repair protein RecO (recombination protein O)